jgi:hypothetical protein
VTLAAEVSICLMDIVLGRLNAFSVNTYNLVPMMEVLSFDGPGNSSQFSEKGGHFCH